MVNAKCEPGCTCKRHRPHAPKTASPLTPAAPSTNHEGVSLPPDGVERDVELGGTVENPHRPVILDADEEAVLALCMGALPPAQQPHLIETVDMVTGTSTVDLRTGPGLGEFQVTPGVDHALIRHATKTRLAGVVRRHWRDLSDRGGNPTDRMLDDLLAAVEQVDWRGAFFQNAAPSS